jgi:hypothetical protein
VELISGGGSVINGATPSSLFCILKHYYIAVRNIFDHSIINRPGVAGAVIQTAL